VHIISAKKEMRAVTHNRVTPTYNRTSQNAPGGATIMTVTTQWFDDEHTIILTEFIGNWTFEELWTVYNNALGMVKSVDHKVDCIVDMSRSSPALPSGSLIQLKRIADYQHPQTGITVYVKANKLMKAITKVFWLFYRSSAEKYPFEFARSVAEAHAILTRHREEWA
jgi:hypothetical protein